MPTFGSIQTTGYDEKVRITDLIACINSDKFHKFKPVRLFGEIFVYRQIWFPIYKEGKPMLKSDGRPVQIPKIVTNYNGATQEYSNEDCPFQKLMEKMNKHLGDKNQLYEAPVFLVNAINRALQEDLEDSKITPPTKAETKSGFRDPESKHQNPVEVLTLNSNYAFKKVKDTMEMNIVKLKSGDKVQKEPTDPKYGYDIQIKFDPKNKVAADRFQVQKGDRSPLTEEELEYLPWNIQAAIDAQVDSVKDAQREADRLWKEFEKSFKKSSKSDDEDSEDNEPDDLEDDDKPVKKAKKKSSFVEDDDEEEDEKPKKKTKKPAEDDDEEEDTPKKKKSLKKARDDDEDEEEEKPAKSIKKAKKPRDDDDEDEEPTPKSKKKPAKKAKDEDEDDDSDDEDLDDLLDDDD